MQYLILLCLSILVLTSLPCIVDTVRNILFKGYDVYSFNESLTHEEDPKSIEDPFNKAYYGFSGNGTSIGVGDSNNASSGVASGDQKPVGFVNNGEFDAVFRLVPTPCV